VTREVCSFAARVRMRVRLTRDRERSRVRRHASPISSKVESPASYVQIECVLSTGWPMRRQQNPRRGLRFLKDGNRKIIHRSPPPRHEGLVTGIRPALSFIRGRFPYSTESRESGASGRTSPISMKSRNEEWRGIESGLVSPR
jgi:hypothetical protein